MPINLIATYTACLPRAVGGARARVFFNKVRKDRFSPSPSASSPYLCLAPPRFLTAARSQSVLPDFHQIGPLRNVFRCTRSGTSARVTPLACAYLLSCGSHRCRHVAIHRPAAWCDQRLMSSRQSRARVCHFDSIRHGSQRTSRVLSPFPLPPSPFYIYIRIYISPSLV